jgi:hypothetical protein
MANVLRKLERMRLQQQRYGTIGLLSQGSDDTILKTGGGQIMPTGACGINCDVCKLRLLGLCSTCGPGKSPEAQRKLAAQKAAFGGTCTILTCAALNRIDYCLRDCHAFPCENFSAGPYPFSEAFLYMQDRRLDSGPPPLDHNERVIRVPPEYWEALRARDTNTLLNLTLFQVHPSGGLVFHSLREDILVDMKNACLKKQAEDGWRPMDDPLLELITLLYLNHVRSLHPLGRDIVGVKDLKEAHYFKGRHELRLTPLLERYGEDLAGFESAAAYCEGQALDMADKAYRFLPFPRVPLYYLLWKGDAEFKPRISVLFDRTIENVFSGPGIWGLVNLVSFALLKGPRRKFDKCLQSGRHTE